MRFRVDAAVYREYIQRAAKKIAGSKDCVTSLDAATGDGDHWVNINMGFEALAAQSDAWQDLPMDELFQKIGMTMMRKIGGSSGILYGGGYLAAGRAVAGRAALGPAEVCVALQAMLDDMMQRGHASPGQKTMIDALAPAVEAFRHGLAAGKDVRQLLAEVAQAARDGAAATREMPAVKGRASYRTDKAVGFLDPGAVTMSYQIECLCDTIAETLP